MIFLSKAQQSNTPKNSLESGLDLSGNVLKLGSIKSSLLGWLYGPEIVFEVDMVM